MSIISISTRVLRWVRDLCRNVAICVAVKGLHGVPRLLLRQEQQQVIQLHMRAAAAKTRLDSSLFCLRFAPIVHGHWIW